MSEHEIDPTGPSEALTPAEEAALADLLAEPLVWDEPDPGLEDRVVAAILAEAARSGPAPAPDLTPRSSRTRRSRRGAARGVLWLTGAAAAAVIALVAVAVLRPAPEDSGQLLALAPTQLAPAGSGAEARIDERPDGTRILLDVHGLAPSPEGSYYEAWLRKSPAVGVSAGTFHLRGGGTERIELWSGVSPADYPLVTITVQEEGKGGDSSGRVVLSGRLHS